MVLVVPPARAASPPCAPYASWPASGRQREHRAARAIRAAPRPGHRVQGSPETRELGPGPRLANIAVSPIGSPGPEPLPAASTLPFTLLRLDPRLAAFVHPASPAREPPAAEASSDPDSSIADPRRAHRAPHTASAAGRASRASKAVLNLGSQHQGIIVSPAWRCIPRSRSPRACQPSSARSKPTGGAYFMGRAGRWKPTALE